MRLIANLFKKSPWLMSIATFFVITLSILPTLSEWGLSYWINKETQSNAKIENIDFNLFTGRLAVENLIIDPQRNPLKPLKLQKFTANVSVLSLFDGKILFDNVILQGVNLPLTIDSQTSKISIAGYEIPTATEQPEPDKEPATPMAIDYGIGALTLTDVNFQLNLDNEMIQYQIETLHLNHLRSWSPRSARLRLSSLLNQQPVDANLQLHLFAKTPKVVGTIDIEALNLQALENRLPESLQALSGKLNLSSTFTLEQAVNGLKLYQYSEIDLQNLSVAMSEQTLSHQSFRWKGNGHLFLGETQGLKLSGELSTQKLAFQQTTESWSQSVGFDLNSQIDLTAQLDPDNIAFQQQGDVRLSNISLSQNAQAIGAQQLSYTGDVSWQQAKQQLDAKGKLKLIDSQFEDTEQALQAKTSAQLDLDLQANLAPEAIHITQKGAIALSDSFVKQGAQTLQAKQLSYIGHFAWQQAAQLLDLKGKLTLANSQVEDTKQALQAKTSAQLDLDLQANLAADAMQLTQKGTIELSESFLKQNAQSLKAETLRYQGNLAWHQAQQTLQAKGDVILSNTALTTADQQLNSSANAKLDLVFQQTTDGFQLSQSGPLRLQQLQLTTADFKQNLQQLAWLGIIKLNQTLPAGKLASKAPQSAIQTLTAKGHLQLERAKSTLMAAQDPALQSEQPSATKRSQSVGFDLNSQLDLTGRFTAEAMRIQLQTDSTLTAIQANTPEHSMQLERLSWQDATKLDIPAQTSDNKALQLSSTIALKLKQLDLSASSQHPMLIQRETQNPLSTIVALESLSIDKIQLPDLEKLELGQTQLTNLIVNDLQTSENLLTLGQLTLDQQTLQLSPKTSIKLGNLVLDNIHTRLHLNQDRSIAQINHLQQSLLPSSSAEAAATEANTAPTGTEAKASAENAIENPPTETAAQSSADFSIESLQLTGNNQVNLSIQEGEHSIQQNIVLNQLALGALSTQSPKVATAYNLDATLNEFSHIRTEGTIAPLANPIALQTTTEIDGLSLLDYSPLVNRAVGYQINSGQLSAKIKGSIKQQIIDFSNDIHLAKFNLEKASKEKSAEFEKNLQMPLKVGLNLLKDKQDNIDLKLPIKGDLSNPNFNPSDVIGTALNGALGKATRAYLLVALQPFGALALAGEFALDQMNAVRFEPVTFAPNQITLNATMQTYLKKVAGLLKEKSTLQVKLCHGATLQDRAAIEATLPKIDTQQSTQASAQKATQVNGQTNADTNANSNNPANARQADIAKRLLDLAKQRQSRVKKSLISQGVKGAQVVLCQPKVIAEDTAPRIDMGI